MDLLTDSRAAHAMGKGIDEVADDRNEMLSSSDVSLPTVATLFPSPVTCTWFAREKQKEFRFVSRSATNLLLCSNSFLSSINSEKKQSLHSLTIAQ